MFEDSLLYTQIKKKSSTCTYNYYTLYFNFTNKGR